MRGQYRAQRIKYALKKGVFNALKLDKLLEQEEKDRLTAAMGFAGQWDEHRRFQLEFLKQQGLKPEDAVLEIGSGPLTLGVPLLRYLRPSRYTGVDIRKSVMDIAYEQVAKNGLTSRNPRLIVSEDFGDQELEDRRFDFVWAFSALYHMDDETAGRLYSQLPRRLAEDGRFFCNINAESEESRWLEFPFVRREPEFYERLGEANGLVMQRHGPMRELGFRLADNPEAENIVLEFRAAA